MTSVSLFSLAPPCPPGTCPLVFSRPQMAPFRSPVTHAHVNLHCAWHKAMQYLSPLPLHGPSNLNSGLHAYTAGTITHRATSPGPSFCVVSLVLWINMMSLHLEPFSCKWHCPPFLWPYYVLIKFSLMLLTGVSDTPALGSPTLSCPLGCEYHKSPPGILPHGLIFTRLLV